MLMPRVVSIGWLMLLSFSALAGDAEFDQPDDAIRYRRAVFEVMSVHFGAINKALTKGPMLQKDVELDAMLVHQMAALPWHAFLPGSINPQSQAKPEVISQKDRFNKMAGDFTSKTAALESAAKSGDKASVKLAFDDTAKSCKDCHEQFRYK